MKTVIISFHKYIEKIAYFLFFGKKQIFGHKISLGETENRKTFHFTASCMLRVQYRLIRCSIRFKFIKKYVKKYGCKQ